jgi:nucleoid DNA-binding protein/cell division septation protein DedD
MENSEYNQRKALISSKVAELLAAHDCVILPGFGGFVGSYAPAKAHPVTHIFTPPSKHILFNSQLKTDDGMLLREIMQELEIEFSGARNWLAQFSELMTDRIMAGERTELPRVGTFTVDPERNIQFRQTEQVNFLASAYGLPSIQASPILKATEYAPRVVSLPQVEKAKDPVTFKSIRRVAVAAVAACIIGAGLFFLPKIQHSQVAEFSVFSSVSDESALTPRSIAALNKVRESNLPEQNRAAFTAESARIFIVAGSYTTQDNADGVIAYLNEKGFSAFILDKTPGGLFRVVYGSYPTIAAASDELSSIRKGLNEEAWMLVR